MTHPPRRRVEPLPPPPGAFDAVLTRANARRYKRASAVVGVTGVFLAGLVGGVGLAGGLTNVQQRIAAVADLGGDRTASTATNPSGTSTSASATRKSTKGTKKKHSATAVATGGRTAGRPAVRGRAVDPSGSPIAGLYVYTGRISTGSFVPSSTAVAVTGVHGGFTVPCTGGGPVMLTDWPLNVGLDTDAEAQWAATLITSPACTTSGTAQVTTVQPGGVVTGVVRTDVSCEGADFPLWLWLYGDRSASVRLNGLSEGDRYRFAGVPAGTSVLGARGRRTSVTVSPAETVEKDITFTCPNGPTPSGTPTDTATPTVKPTPSDSTTTPTQSTPSQTGSTSTSTATSTSPASPSR